MAPLCHPKAEFSHEVICGFSKDLSTAVWRLGRFELSQFLVLHAPGVSTFSAASVNVSRASSSERKMCLEFFLCSFPRLANRHLDDQTLPGIGVL